MAANMSSLMHTEMNVAYSATNRDTIQRERENPLLRLLKKEKKLTEEKKKQQKARLAMASSQ
ncbi:hypothetical protein U1Q18_027196 [Sarracenia purpurea var. burkii]